MPTTTTQTPYKTCRCCGATYTREEWLELPYVGEQVDEVEGLMVYRNCNRCPGETPSTLVVCEPVPFASEAA